MRCDEFILRDMDRILDRWELAIAGGVCASHTTPPSLPRSHLRAVLQAIAGGLGCAPACGSGAPASKTPLTTPVGPPTAAQAHGVLRAEGGYAVEGIVADYRELRASVLRGWIDACRPAGPPPEEQVRFARAVDDALEESVRHYSAHVSRARSLLMGMLSHDIRSPLATVQATACALHRLHANDDVGRAAEVLLRSGARMHKLLEEQLDLSRVELGLGLRVAPHDVDLGPVCSDELRQIGVAHAEHPVHLEVSGDCRGSWDPGRFQQMLNNLVVNAVQYGTPHGQIQVSLRGAAAHVQLTVSNVGEQIDDETLAHIFEPMRRGRTGARRQDSGLGLGLYIASEIAKAHGGTIAAESKGRHTVFTVCLPRFGRPMGLR